MYSGSVADCQATSIDVELDIPDKMSDGCSSDGHLVAVGHVEQLDPAQVLERRPRL